MENDLKKISGNSLSEIAEHIVQMPVPIAERALEDIARRKGDGFVKEILTQLSPVKIAAILRQHDFSCPSFVNWILSPEIIVNILKSDPLFWRDIYDKHKFGVFPQIQNDALDLVVSILEHAENRDKQEEILGHIHSDRLSLLYLCLPFIEWQIKKEQTLFLEDPDIDFGTADHLYEIIRWASPYVAEEILSFVNSARISVLNHITDLWLEALDRVDPDHDCCAIEAAMFLPVESHGRSLR